jgi:hypothetical protein
VKNEPLQAALADGGWNVVAVGQGDYRAIKTVARMSGFKGDIIVDFDQPKLPAFHALGSFPGGKDTCGFKVEQAFIGTFVGIRRVWFQGHRGLMSGFSLTKTDFLIQGGCLLIGPDCTPTYQKMFRQTNERWPIEELLAQVTQAGPI